MSSEKIDVLYIVIPAYNEEANIADVARQWHKIAAEAGGESRVVIIDDGSTDKTYPTLEELQQELPQLIAVTKPNGGHGQTVLYGYHYALECGADYVFQTDSDGQTLPSEFKTFWENRSEFDIQIGYRKGRQDGISRIIVTTVLKLTLFFTFGLWIKDANTPYRLMSSQSLGEIILNIPKDHNLSNVLLTVFYYKHKKAIKYHQITFRPRQGGVNSINFKKICRIGLNAVKDFASLRKTKV